jgi:hypothetical protein
MSDAGKRLRSALEQAEKDLETSVAAAKAAKAAGDEFTFECARQSANEAYERLLCLSHDVASAHGA